MLGALINFMKSRSQCRPRQGGFTLVGAVLVIGFTVALGSTVALISYSQTRLQSGIDHSLQTKNIAVSGYEYAIALLDADKDWSDNPSTLFSNKKVMGGKVSVTLSNLTTDSVTIRSVATYKGHQFAIDRELQRSVNTASYHKLSVSNGYVTGTSSYPNYRLAGMQLTNIHPTQDIHITNILFAWQPFNGEGLNEVRIDGRSWWATRYIGNNYYATFYPPPRIRVGESDTLEIAFRRWESMLGKVFTLYFYFSDGSYEVAEIQPLQEESRFLLVDTGTFKVSGSNKLTDLTFANTNLYHNITIDKMRLDWAPNNSSARVTKVEFVDSSAQTVWTGNAGDNQLINISDFELAQDTHYKAHFTLSPGSMNPAQSTFNVTYIMSDGSEKTVEVDFAQARQQQDFVVNTAGAYLDGSSVLRDIYLSNVSSENSVIIEKMKVSFVPTPSSGMTVDELLLGSAEPLISTSLVGQQFDIASYKIRPQIANVPLHISLSDPIYGDATANVSFYFTDGTSQTASFRVSSTAVASNFLQVATQNARVSIQNAYRSVSDITLANSNPAIPMTIEGITVTWAPDSDQELEKIYIDNTEVFDGDLESGEYADITDTQIGESVPFKISFDNSVLTTDFTITFHLTDGTQVTQPVIFNPASVIAGDNFESGDFNGGAGFTSSWNTSGGASVSHIFSYTGFRYLYLRGSTDRVERSVDLSGAANPKIRFFGKTYGFESDDEGYFEISDDAGSTWQRLHTFTDAHNSFYYTYYEFDLSGYSRSSDFRIAFEAAGSNLSDKLSIDEVFIFE